MRIALGVALTLITSTVHAEQRFPSRAPDAPRTRVVPDRFHATPDRPPPPPTKPAEVGVLGSLLGGVALVALGAGYVLPRGGGQRRGFGSRRSGYAALTPSLARVREVSIAPAVTPDGVHGGISLRW